MTAAANSGCDARASHPRSLHSVPSDAAKEGPELTLALLRDFFSRPGRFSSSGTASFSPTSSACDENESAIYISCLDDSALAISTPGKMLSESGVLRNRPEIQSHIRGLKKRGRKRKTQHRDN
jgi:hypothetical protein